MNEELLGSLAPLDLHQTCLVHAVSLTHLVLDGVVSLLDLLLETLDVLLQVADDVVQLGCLRLQLLDLLLVVIDLFLKAGELHAGNTAGCSIEQSDGIKFSMVQMHYDATGLLPTDR